MSPRALANSADRSRSSSGVSPAPGTVAARTAATAASKRSLEDGPAALEEMRRSSYPVVLLDAMMPGMDGLALAERIRKLAGTEGTVLVMLSSAGAPEEARMRLKDDATGRAVGFAERPCEKTILTLSILPFDSVLRSSTFSMTRDDGLTRKLLERWMPWGRSNARTTATTCFGSAFVERIWNTAMPCENRVASGVAESSPAASTYSAVKVSQERVGVTGLRTSMAEDADARAGPQRDRDVDQRDPKGRKR